MRHRKTWLSILLTTLMALTLAVASPASATVDPSPRNIRIAPIWEDSSFPRAMATSMIWPSRSPIGANDWSCKPSPAHPKPVVLIHGTWENAYDNWNGLSPILTAQGYCVFAVNYGNTTGLAWLNGTGDMIAAANQIATFVAKVRAATGASQVSLVGHSQGGAQARYYANLLAPKGEVADVIALAPSNHPTNLDGIVNLKNVLGLDPIVAVTFNLLKMPAAEQQSTNSLFYRNLNGNGETVAGIRYTTIATKFDEVVTPYTQAFIQAGAGANVDNVTIQQLCPLLDTSEHISISYDKNVAQVVLNALDPDHQHKIRCYLQLPISGSTS